MDVMTLMRHFCQVFKRVVPQDVGHAEMTKVLLENCVPLDERRLCWVLGYQIDDLTAYRYLLVPFGCLRNFTLEAGKTIAVCPATGGFEAAAVMIAAAMGARVIAGGRNERS